jgi:hypothetical protein
MEDPPCIGHQLVWSQIEVVEEFSDYWKEWELEASFEHGLVQTYLMAV